MSYKVGKPEGLNFSDSEDERVSKSSTRRKRIKSPRRISSPDPNQPSWGFGNSRAPSRGDFRDDERVSSRALDFYETFFFFFSNTTTYERFKN